jgi:hypothetical protein
LKVAVHGSVWLDVTVERLAAAYKETLSDG